MARLETALRARRDAGGHAFVPYVTGGYPGVDARLLRRLEAAGADAIEVGVPFSDPVMDGGVIQEASAEALRAGARLSDVLATVRAAATDVPVAVMTYVNPVHRTGFDRFLDDAAAAGVAGAIVPDLPVDESAELEAASATRGIDLVLLAAPGSAPARLAEIGRRSRGFVYCVATYGVTGARDRLDGTAEGVVRALRPHTDLPLLVGVGIGSPSQAAEVCGFADGIVVGSALMARVVAGDLDGAVALASSFRGSVPA
ncbi:MAG: tryptophan synthase subunit alpha [Actinomycetota bacterium]